MPSEREREGTIIDYETSDRISFIIPAEYGETKAANWSQMDVLGRSEPLFGYSSSGVREFGLNLTFPISLFAKESGNSRRGETLLSKIRFLQSFVYPDYQEADYTKAPHRMIVTPGSWLSLLCLLQSYSVNYRAPYDVDTRIPHLIDIGLQLLVISEEKVSDFADVRAGRADLTKQGEGSSGSGSSGRPGGLDLGGQNLGGSGSGSRNPFGA